MAKKFLVALIVGIGIALAVPAAAGAQPYTAGSSCHIDPSVVHPGGRATFTCDPGTFTPSETVDFTFSGYHVSGSAGHFRGVATADGGVTTVVTTPPDAQGAYQVTATGVSSRAASAATVTVLPGDPAVSQQTGNDPSASANASAQASLAATGSTIATSAAWIGGGLVFAGLIVMTLRSARRRRTAP